VAYVCTRLAYALTSRHDPETGDKLTQKRGGFRTGQIFTSSLVALAHGTNDAQKTMGIITLVLIAAGTQPTGSGPQFWVIAACAFAIAVGTYAGGWRIIRTMGSGLTEVKPAQGFSAESSTASAILASSHLGFALSTTQVASGSVIGSGLGRRGTAVVIFMFIYSRKSHVGHHNAVEVEEAGTAVKFQKKKSARKKAAENKSKDTQR
jgi:PiT family inorganic phosphate transporter